MFVSLNQKSSMYNCNQNSISNHYIPKDLLVIPLGKFKGKYDTRRFRCYRDKCHNFNIRGCLHCKYLPYTSSPLRNKNYYCENIEIKDLILRYNIRNGNEPYNNENSLVWLLKDVERYKDISNFEKVALNTFATHLPLNLVYPNFHQTENANIDKTMASLIKITNRIRLLILVSSLKKANNGT